jgi:valyl-tRNA synthetase
MNKKENLKKPYEPKDVENKICFSFSENLASKKDPFCIIMPPPNITGALHMGHALVTTIQDILIRFNRMNGKQALWVPGTDHAGIATQSVVEKKIFKETGKKRTDFNRDEFVSKILEWKDIHQEKITSQIKKLGASADWSKERFTLDENATFAVKTAFKKLFDQGLIYRGDYLVNWDTHLQTAIADDEVEHEEKDGHLWYFSYPVENSNEKITIATTRPETMLADTAVAVNGSDERYKHLIGKNVILPITFRVIPIIKDHYVDKDFGSGAVKITPAHDFNDYEIGIRHNLPMINILNQDGTINENGGQFKSMSILDARANIIEMMRSLNLLEKVEFHSHRVSISYRSKSIIQPLLSKQWFLKMEPFKEKLLSAIFDEKIALIPKEWEKTYKHWIENIKDWCVSRQLWWGHRIPIWYDKENEDNVICSTDEEPLEVKANPKRYRREEDVLDTWFSSALWPLTCLGWPEKTADIKKFYPTSVLVTGHDILFFWVARMILMGEFFGGDVPFHKVFLHGLIFAKSYWRKDTQGNIHYLDKAEWIHYEKGASPPSDIFFKWEKMSKSKGNVIDPLDIIEEYGTDALRLALTSSVTTAKQIDLDFRKFEEGKNFANKIWNASSFVIQNISSDLSGNLKEELFKLEDNWILSKYSLVIKSCHEAIESFNFANLFNALYRFFWDDFCAYYIEISKPYLYEKMGSLEERQNKKLILLVILTASIKLLHPIAPFITEELFFILKEENFKLSNHPLLNQIKEDFTKIGCAFCNLPVCNIYEKDAVDVFEQVKETLHIIRNICREINIPPGEKIKVDIEEKNSPLKDYENIFHSLSKISSIQFYDLLPNSPSHCSIATSKNRKIRVFIPESLLEKEKIRLQKTLEKTIQNIQNLKMQLSNKDFTDKAPRALIEEKQTLYSSLLNTEKEIKEKLSSF